MYTVSKGPSKIVAKTRRGLSQNYEKFETIKESGKRSTDLNSPEKNNIPRPVFQTTKRAATQVKQIEEEVITPQHEEIIRYINDSWNIIVAHNPYDTTFAANGKANSDIYPDTNNNNSSISTSNGTTNGTSNPASSCGSTSSSGSCTSASSSLCNSAITSPQPTASVYCIEPPSPVLSDFKPFDLESWWGRRLFNNITKSL